jgi:hypothetical protein
MSFTAKAVNVDQYVLLRHEGRLTRREFKEGRLSAKRILAEQRWNWLLVDVRSVVNRLPIAEVYYAIETNKSVLPGAKIALVFPPEREEEGKFADMVAANRSVQLKSFMDYEQAVVWLTGKTRDQVCGGSV